VPVVRLALAQGFAQAGFHAWIATIPVAMHLAGRPDGEIGAIVGAAALFHLLAGLGVGGLIDRFGGRALYVGGCLFLVVAAVPIALGLVDAASPAPAWFGVRLLQGVGIAAVLPSVSALVPSRVSARNMSMALASVGVAGNISLALTPLLSLLILDRAGLTAVGIVVCVSVAGGALLLWTDPSPDGERGPVTAAGGRRLTRISRAFRPAWRAAWAAPLAATFLFVAHWGVVTGYLAQRAEPAGADIGLFFTGDALALLALRIPTGWLAGRIPALPLILTGVVVTCASLALLLPPPTTGLLVVAGIGTGAGSALFFPPIMVELARRSGPADRGSAFGLYSVAFGSGIALGSLGLAPIYESVGFEVAMALGLGVCAASGLVALVDRPLRERPLEAGADLVLAPASEAAEG
jgi:MFS family permease